MPKPTYEDLLRQHTKAGKYTESTGGGDPIRKGESFQVAPDTATAAQMRKANPGTKVRVDQPRDDQGQFTYNSANFKELKYGPSRGTTIPPQLRGLEIAFAKKSSRGAINLGGTWYDIGKLSFTEFSDTFKRYQKYGSKYQEDVGKARGIQYQKDNKGGYTPDSHKIKDYEAGDRSSRAKSSEYSKLERGGKKLSYAGDTIAFEKTFTPHIQEWDTMNKQPRYARNKDSRNIHRWKGDVEPRKEHKVAPKTPVAISGSTKTPVALQSKSTKPASKGKLGDALKRSKFAKYIKP